MLTSRKPAGAWPTPLTAWSFDEAFRGRLDDVARLDAVGVRLVGIGVYNLAWLGAAFARFRRSSCRRPFSRCRAPGRRPGGRDFALLLRRRPRPAGSRCDQALGARFGP